MKKIIKYMSVLFVMGFAVLIVFEPDVCRDGAFTGLVISGKIIIPSLFPFTMCVLYITYSGVLSNFNFLTRITKASFGMNATETTLMLLSFVGGYPVGAKLLNNAVKSGEISPRKARIMLRFCINAGPAFIVTAVGSGILNSASMGYILLLCHIMSATVLCIISRKSLKSECTEEKNSQAQKLGVSENFVISAADASASVMGICGFVILFSVINGYVKHFAQFFGWLEIVALGLEVTNALTLTNNLYIIAFLLGFSGVCVWCQILSVSTEIKINYLEFALFRILHGLLSSLFLYVLLKIFKISVATFSEFKVEYVYSTPVLSISMLLTCIVFAISVVSKKYTGKILEDMV